MALFLTLLVGCAVSALGSRPSYGYHPQPSYGKHSYCDPRAAPVCSKNGTLMFCLEDTEYPLYDIKGAISSDPLFAKKFSDLPKQSADDLVEGLTKEEEDAFDYSFYTGASTGKSPYDVTHWSGPAGYICPSEVVYCKPRRAKNVAGEWRVIVNDDHYYKQTLRVETCEHPDAACRLVPICVKNKCTQKYVYHRLLSFDPCDPYKGLFIDVYRFPSACSCHIMA